MAKTNFSSAVIDAFSGAYISILLVIIFESID